MEVLLQIFIFSLVAAAVYALIAAGLTLTFGALEFINFAHGDMATIGAYAFFSSYVIFDLPFLACVLITAAAGLIAGLVIERFTFRPVRDRHVFIPLVMSIGVAIVIQSIVTMFYGGGSHTYFRPGQSPTVFKFFDGQVTFTLTQLLIVFTAVLLLGAVYLFLKYTRTGKAIRAVSDNKQIASVLGIDTDRIMMTIFAIASVLAALGGILVGFDQNLFPRMGLFLSIKVFVVIILGGVGNFWGAIIGALIVGFSENLFVGLTGISATYKETVVFGILIIVLIFKPYGILGAKKEEVESR